MNNNVNQFSSNISNSAQQQQQQQPTFKYINRIKHLYDRERASSTESLSSVRNPSAARLRAAAFAASPQSSLVKGSFDEASVASDADDSVVSSSMAGANGAPRSNKYIKQLCDTFNSNQAPALEVSQPIVNTHSYSYSVYPPVIS